MRRFFPLTIVVILTIPAIWWFLGPGYYNMHDDLQVMRLYQMEKCLSDGQIPCRWSPDMAYGYGQAMFNFYSAFPYYLGALIRVLTPLSIIGTVKTLFLISFVGAAIGMYLLAREFWGKKGGIVSAVLYTYAPYHALDIYVRGALAEAFALGLLPFLLLYFYLLVKKPSNPNVLVVAIILFFLLTTHNVSTMMYAPFIIFWVVFWISLLKKWKSIWYVGLAGLMGVGLASFFLLPALFEQSIIQTRFLTEEYSNYHGHYVTLRQLFQDRSWGDGPSIFGDKENISFQIGWPHWWLGTPLTLFIIFSLINRKFDIKRVVLIPVLSLAGFTAFLTHSKSVHLWENFPQMAFIQFPWRFLGLTIFFLSFAGGALSLISFRFKNLLLILIVFLTIILNYKYFIPVHYSRLVKDEEKLSGIAFELQQKSAILDYLPKTANIAPQSKSFEKPKVISGDGTIENFNKSSSTFSFDSDVYNEVEIEVPVMYFPGWVVLVDGMKKDSGIHGDYGLIKIDIAQGKHFIQGWFTNTKVRTLGNAITLFSFAILITGFSLSNAKKD